MITKFCANPEQNQESSLNVWTFESTGGKMKFSVLFLTTFLLSAVIPQVNIQTGQQMLGLICSLQRDKPGRQLEKSVVVLKTKIWREQKGWSQREGNLNSQGKRSASVILSVFCTLWISVWVLVVVFQVNFFINCYREKKKITESTEILVPVVPRNFIVCFIVLPSFPQVVLY